MLLHHFDGREPGKSCQDPTRMPKTSQPIWGRCCCCFLEWRFLAETNPQGISHSRSEKDLLMLQGIHVVRSAVKTERWLTSLSGPVSSQQKCKKTGAAVKEEKWQLGTCHHTKDKHLLDILLTVQRLLNPLTFLHVPL